MVSTKTADDFSLNHLVLHITEAKNNRWWHKSKFRGKLCCFYVNHMYQEENKYPSWLHENCFCFSINKSMDLSPRNENLNLLVQTKFYWSWARGPMHAHQSWGLGLILELQPRKFVYGALNRLLDLLTILLEPYHFTGPVVCRSAISKLSRLIMFLIPRIYWQRWATVYM